MSTDASENLIKACIKNTNDLLPIIQEIKIYRSSVAYFLQHIKAFIAAIEPLRHTELTQIHIRALERFLKIISDFSLLIPTLSNNYLQTVLKTSSVKMHEYIDEVRKTLRDIIRQLDMDPDEIIQFDSRQNNVNCSADLQQLKTLLREYRESVINVDNVLDIHQMIEARLHSINSHLPHISKKHKVKPVPSSDDLPVSHLKSKMENALGAFRSIDIGEDEIRLGEPLGSGGFGTVYIATRLSTAELLAVKEVRTDKLTMSTWASLYSEVATMAPLRHRHVLELVGAHIKEPYRIITRFCPGKSLFDRLHRNLPPHLVSNYPQNSNNPSYLSAEKLTNIAYQVAEGMVFLHKNGIVHRDLKTMNILLDEYDCAKIADFGLAGMMKGNDQLIGGVGTPHYTAPEILDRRRYGPKVDSYSFGVILWEMATRMIPFSNKTHNEIYEHVVTRGWRLPLGNTIPDGMKKLISRCWCANPQDRPEFTEIVELFKSKTVFFAGGENAKLDSLEGSPPLDLKYLDEVFQHPEEERFCEIVTFLTHNMDSRLKGYLRSLNIIDPLVEKGLNLDKVLLLSGYLLEDSEFETFISTKADPIISKLLPESVPEVAHSILSFILNVPQKHFNALSRFYPQLIERIGEPPLQNLIVQLISRVPTSQIHEYCDQLVQLFSSSFFKTISSQETMNAVAVLLPMIVDKIPNNVRISFSSLLETPYTVPIDLISLLIEKTGKESIATLTLALLKAVGHSDVGDPLGNVVSVASDEALLELSEEPGIFELIDSGLKQNKFTNSLLLLLFSICSLQQVPQKLTNHPILNTLYDMEGYTAQKLQIFTALFLSEEFLKNTIIGDGVLKLLISSMNDEKLANFSIKMIGALSSHRTGCKLITDSGMLPLFSQMFLSPMCSDAATALIVISNLSKARIAIPQVSLIISCLMQDLMYTSSKKAMILDTLVKVVSMENESVQEHDLQNVILPLLTIGSEPTVVYLALRLLDCCSSSKLSSIHSTVILKIYNLLSCERYQIVKIIEASVALILTISLENDITYFLRKTLFVTYVKSVLEQVDEKSESGLRLANSIYSLKQAEKLRGGGL